MVLSAEFKMYPAKNVFDYMSEMNRFTRTGEDLFQQSPPISSTSSLFYQSAMAHSSSSTETSPDSFPDLTQSFQPELSLNPDYQRNIGRPYNLHYGTNQPEIDFRPEHSFEGHIRPLTRNMHPQNWSTNDARSDYNQVAMEQIFDTPLIARRQRPIMGRRIMTEAPLNTISEFPMWHPNLPQTPPRSLEKTNQYELFPTDHGYDYPSPIKSPQKHLATPPRIPLSPKASTPSITPPSHSPFSPRMPTPFKEPLIGPGSSFKSNHGGNKMCTFCRKNGEAPLVYMTHAVKERDGNKHVVTCPILRSHVCAVCGASGDDAHTITYCPVLQNGNNGQRLTSTTITLKNTRIKSNGRRRF